MEFNPETIQKIESFITKSIKKKEYEFELRFRQKNINHKKFASIFDKFTFSKSNNGFEFSYIMIKELDIYLRTDNQSKSRMTIHGDDEIKKYWLGADFDESKITFMEKEKIENYDDDDYQFRCSLNHELEKNNILEKNKSLLKSNNSNKYYRLKNRYRIQTGSYFYIDLTIVKQGYGVNLKESKALKAIPQYEIEIELDNEKKIDEKKCMNELIQIIYSILRILNESNGILGIQRKEEIMDAYKKLVDVKRNDNFFIAANPVTLHKQNLVKSDEFKNIVNRYSVTLKADGERNFAIVLGNGEIYFINNNQNVVYSGYNCKSYANSLIEGEMINFTGNKRFYAYDMLFSQGNDIRRRLLKSLRKRNESFDEKLEGRLDMLLKFLNAKDLKKNKLFDERFNIEIKIKPYEISLQTDGLDIFPKTEQIWRNRSQNEFEVDGLIFTPIYTHYPLKGGKWTDLFKWKPPNLNSIDFLVKFLRDKNGSIVNSPYIDNVKRLDDKVERKLKLYRTLILYVGGSNFEYNYRYKKMMKVLKPVLFNPLRKEEIVLEFDQNNTAKLFIDSEQRIYAFDPITKNKEEIQDDTIIECSFDTDASDGFHWVPIRVRHDKTTEYKEGKNQFGNNENTANDIYRSIKSPVTEEMVTTGKVDIGSEEFIEETKSYFSQLDDINEGKKKRYPYQNFHNQYIKYQLFYLTSPNYLESLTSGQKGKILDGCSGKGVDITKIKKAHYAEVVGLEIDQTAVQYATSYYKTSVSRPKPKAYYVQGDLSKLIFPNQACAFSESGKFYTKKFIPNKFYFDTMCLMFCLHYFFKNEITLRTIIQNMNDSLKLDGYVIGTCFDGANLYNQLREKSSISGKKNDGSIMWKIDKKYKGRITFGQRQANLGKEVDVFVQTIGNIHKEYLVKFAYLEKIMSEYGFEKVTIKPFEEFYDELKENQNILKLEESEFNKMKDYVDNMSDEEKRFSFLSSAFIFKKKEKSSDTLYTKLVTLMEKEARVQGDILKVDKAEEGIIVQDELDK